MCHRMSVVKSRLERETGDSGPPGGPLPHKHPAALNPEFTGLIRAAHDMTKTITVRCASDLLTCI